MSRFKLNAPSFICHECRLRYTIHYTLYNIYSNVTCLVSY